MAITERTGALANQCADTQFRLQATLLGEPIRFIKSDSFQGHQSQQQCRIVNKVLLQSDNCRSLEQLNQGASRSDLDPRSRIPESIFMDP